MPKISSRFKYNSNALGVRGKQKIQKMIKKPSFCEATRDFCFGWETAETEKKKKKKVGNASTITVICIEKKKKTPPNKWTSCCERPF